MGCSYPQPIRELFINVAANQVNSWFAHSNLDFITDTYGGGSVRYVRHELHHPTPNTILVDVQINSECHKIAVHLCASLCQ